MTIAARHLDNRNGINTAGVRQKPMLRYVLSAGRTGTVFLEKLFGLVASGVTAVHEPSSARYQMMLANFRNDWRIGHAVLESWFQRSRLAREAAVSGTYVELNPFLCPMTDLLPERGRRLHVVHMVREPAGWARSITTFKASRKFRGVVDYVPFAKPYPSPRPARWQDLDDYERALWRWNWCNERILAIREQCDDYALVRYEDLFSSSPATRQDAISTIFQTLALGPTPVVEQTSMNERVNPAPDKGEIIDPDGAVAREICGLLARRFGYDD